VRKLLMALIVLVAVLALAPAGANAQWLRERDGKNVVLTKEHKGKKVLLKCLVVNGGKNGGYAALETRSSSC
jgi:hypothetical protein